MAVAVKICGLCRPEDAAHAAQSGADYLGVVLHRRSRRGQSATRAGGILDAGPGPRRVGVFVDAALEEVLEAAASAKLDVVQLHGGETPEQAARLRSESGLEVWKAVRPLDGREFRRGVEAYAGAVDAVLVDGWTVEAAGGTGARFPWEAVAAELGEVGPVRLGIAGGLDAHNVAEAVRRLRPAFVDVSSGVEAVRCRKDPDRVKRFIAAARAAGLEAIEAGE